MKLSENMIKWDKLYDYNNHKFKSFEYFYLKKIIKRIPYNSRVPIRKHFPPMPCTTRQAP